MKSIIVFTIGVISLCLAPLIHAQDVNYDYIESNAVDASVSEYLYVDIIGNGSVSFKMPSEKGISSSGTAYAQVPVAYGTVPGVGVLVTFSTSKPAFVTTSDSQTFSVYAYEQKQILIKNLSYPQITIRFNY